jgi:phosphohistidine swiveling domain-containing protein
VVILDDIVRRLLHNLLAKPLLSFKKLPYDAILVGKQVPPSTLFELRSQRIVGLATETGSPLSHTAIMARSLEIPAIVGAAELSEVASGDWLIVDGERGIVIWSPSDERLAEYKSRDRDGKKLKKRVGASVSAPSITEDSVQVSLGANINFSEEIRAAGGVRMRIDRTVSHGIRFLSRGKAAGRRVAGGRLFAGPQIRERCARKFPHDRRRNRSKKLGWRQYEPGCPRPEVLSRESGNLQEAAAQFVSRVGERSNADSSALRLIGRRFGFRPQRAG